MNSGVINKTDLTVNLNDVKKLGVSGGLRWMSILVDKLGVRQGLSPPTHSSDTNKEVICCRLDSGSFF